MQQAKAMDVMPHMNTINLLVLCSGLSESWTVTGLPEDAGVNVWVDRSTFGFALIAVAAAVATFACDSAITALVLLFSCKVSLSIRISTKTYQILPSGIDSFLAGPSAIRSTGSYRL